MAHLWLKFAPSSLLIRADALGVIAHAILKCECIRPLQEMQASVTMKRVSSLTSTTSSFTDGREHFNDLGSANNARKAAVTSKTPMETFVPLVEHFLVSFLAPRFA